MILFVRFLTGRFLSPIEARRTTYRMYKEMDPAIVGGLITGIVRLLAVVISRVRCCSLRKLATATSGKQGAASLKPTSSPPTRESERVC